MSQCGYKVAGAIPMARVIASDGIALHAEAHGEGEAIVFSPGYGQTHENFRPQVEPLVAAGYRVVLWDYRGHGRSDAPALAEAYSLEQVLDDLARVLDWAAPEAPEAPVVLAGLSFGGLASQHFALRTPARVAALILLASGPGFRNPRSQATWEAQVGRTADRLERIGFEGYTSGRAGPSTVGLRPELPAARVAARAIEAQNPRGVAHFGRRISGPAPATLDRLGEIPQPTLVLVGSLDHAYRPAAQVMTDKLPNARHIEIEDAGHCLNIEQSDALNRALLTFLEKRER